MIWLYIILFFVAIVLAFLFNDFRVDGRTKIISLILKIHQKRAGLYIGGRFERTKLGGVPKEEAGVIDGIESFDVEEEFNGEEISLRFFHKTDIKKEEKYSLMIHIHGGGFCDGSPSNKSDSDFVRSIISKTGTVVASVDYRKSPEHAFPIPFEDTYNCILFIMEHIFPSPTEIGKGKQTRWKQLLMQIDPTRIALCGISSGANLALATIMKFRDEQNKFSKVISAQLLLFPMLNHHPMVQSRKIEKNSWTLPESLITWYEESYCGQNKENFKNPYFAPLNASSFTNLPDTFLLTAERDPLKDESLLLKNKIINDSGNVLYKSYPNQTHGFTLLYYLKDSQRSLMDITQFLLNYNIGDWSQWQYY
ncbi:ab hydrolase superfamily protein c4a8.06c [Anaeramoeba flamelloides]|uniref:Ab hydrolase superfamily protein c4a8.06c n=1 Tax=Anaeramoeba flamelloides TaxID=1746091 RepID=A0AAV7YMF7_9EUKA|nr:ab hydrolase superfamily protein c4a8.06c [Anaeramoeba flamelloides]